MSILEKNTQTGEEIAENFNPKTDARWTRYWVAKTLENEKNQLKAKIAEANKILEPYPSDQEYIVWDLLKVREAFNKLKAILNDKPTEGKT